MGICNGISSKWLFIHCFQMELEFRSGRRKTGEPGEKPSDQGPEKLNPHMTPGPWFEPWTHWWEASALATAPSLHLICIYEWSRSRELFHDVTAAMLVTFTIRFLSFGKRVPPWWKIIFRNSNMAAMTMATRNGAEVKALPSYKCGPGSIRLGLVCCWSSPFSRHKNRHLQIPITSG